MFSVLCCFWTKPGQWSSLPEQHCRLGVVLLKNSMPNIEEAQKMSTTEVGLKSKYKGCVCSVNALRLEPRAKEHIDVCRPPPLPSMRESTAKLWSFCSGNSTRNPYCFSKTIWYKKYSFVLGWSAGSFSFLYESLKGLIKNGLRWTGPCKIELTESCFRQRQCRNTFAQCELFISE